jgi:hypothetical protein
MWLATGRGTGGGGGKAAKIMRKMYSTRSVGQANATFIVACRKHAQISTFKSLNMEFK